MTADSPTAPTSTLFVASVTLEQRAVNSGGSVAATVTLNEAPPDATVVRLASDSPAAVVAASVIVPAGSRTAHFQVLTEPVNEDVFAAITATLNSRETRARLSLWSFAPNSFWYDSEVGEWIGGGMTGHFTPATASMIAGCGGNSVSFQARRAGEIWSADVVMPDGVPVQPGTWFFHDTGSRPFFQLRGPGRSCQARGEFTIVTADLASTGMVKSLVVRFKQACENTSPTIQGEIRLTNPPVTTSGDFTPSHCLR